MKGGVEVNDFADVYTRVVGFVLHGKRRDARVALEGVPERPAQVRHARHVSERAQLKVFRRDGFRCRYCDRRAVLPPVLRLLSLPFGDVFPYHPHGRMDTCHLAFWRDMASCDHLVPVARGGTSEAANLVCSCYMCNSIKQNWLVAELGWEVRSVTPERNWDGLSMRYPALLEAVRKEHREADGPYFRRWARAVESF